MHRRTASAGLRILQTEIDDAGTLSVLYGGERGCRLGLWITPAPQGMKTVLEGPPAGPYRAYSWRVGALAYVMLSQIDTARLRVIAETAHRVTTERRAINEAMAAALAESRRTSTRARFRAGQTIWTKSASPFVSSWTECQLTLEGRPRDGRRRPHAALPHPPNGEGGFKVPASSALK